MFELWAHPASQPSRSVLWLCALNDAACPVHHDPEKSLAEVNPRQQIPVLADADFALSEMPAIMAYLCDKHGWLDWYPRELQSRARIDQYLHTHHTLTRLATLKLMAPHVLIAFESPPLGNETSVLTTSAIQSAMTDEQMLANGVRVMSAVVDVIEQHYLTDDGAYLCGLAQPSIADLACYEELAQLEWANLMDLSAYPNVAAWRSRMAELPHHEPLHRYNKALGDVATSANTMDRMMAAIQAGMGGLIETGFTLAD